MPIVTALRQFTYNTRTVRPGDPVEMDATEALVHARQGNITLSRQVQTRVMAVPPELQSDDAVESPPRRKRYRRRDLQAEP